MVGFLNIEKRTMEKIEQIFVDEENEITIYDIYRGMKNFVGVYTYDQKDAELLSKTVYGTTNPDKAKEINYYNHYHVFIPNGNKDARLHIWYGLPFAGNEV